MKLLTFIVTYVIIFMLLVAAITFMVLGIETRVGELVICGIFGAIIGGGISKTIKAKVPANISLDTVDGPIRGHFVA
jgi:hypothetical protein